MVHAPSVRTGTRRVVAFVGTVSLALASLVGVFGVSPAGAATTLYVGPGGGSGNCASPTYSTIQSAVTAASAGDTVQVCAGTYAEQVVIHKALTLQGAGDSTIIRPAAPSDLATLYTYPAGTLWPGTVMAAIILVHNTGTAAVTVKDLKVDGVNVTSFPAGAGRLAGVLYGESAGTVTNVTVNTIHPSGCGDIRSYGIDLSAVGTAVTVEVAGNRVTDFTRNGIQAQGGSLTANIHDNQITGPAALNCVSQVPNGILFIQNAGGNATNNTIHGLHFTPISVGSPRSAGILAFGPLPAGIVFENNNVYNVDDGVDLHGSTGVIVRSNNLHDNLETGVHLESGTTGSSITDNIFTGDTIAGIRLGGALDPNGTDPPGVGNTAHFNSFSGNGVGVVNYDTQTFDASDNWWGCANGPGAAGCATVSAKVTVSPWLATLKLSPSSQTVPVGANATVQATLLDNTGATVPAPLDVIFTTNPFIVSLTTPLFSGTASFTFSDSVAQNVTVSGAIGFGSPPVASSLGGSATVNFSAQTTPAPTRIFGVDAIGTAISVSQAEFPGTGASSVKAAASTGLASAVVLARSDFFSDALAGGPLAANVGGPLLITPGTALSASLDGRVQTEILRVLPTGKTVYILGGPQALSPSIDTTLTGLGYQVVRVQGANLFATAVAIASQLGNPSTVFEATGLFFADALSAVPATIHAHGAILLTNGTTPAPETLIYLAAHSGDTRYAIGGPLAAFGADPGATPVFGPDLYGTSAAVATRFFPNAAIYGAATGLNFPDALAGGVYMATGGRLGPVLLVNTHAPLPGPISGYLNTLAVGTPGIVFGGPVAVADDVLTALQAAVG
jgi:ell wall binding domain 2 (CWB2)/Right handed beta helix region